MFDEADIYARRTPIVPSRKKIKSSPALIIFHRYYVIRTSGLNLLSEKAVELFGTITTGVKADDEAMQSAIRVAQATIADMAEMLTQGATFTVESPEKANEIFDVIQRHLEQWSRVVNSSFNANDVPMKGLQELEHLAQYLYPYAMRLRKATRVESHLYRSLLDMVSKRQSVIDRTMYDKKSTDEDTKIEPYRSITEDLTRTLEQRSSLWK